jgi:hypothetical protein
MLPTCAPAPRPTLGHVRPGGERPFREEENMKKMSIRKAGTIRLTSAAYYCCAF